MLENINITHMLHEGTNDKIKMLAWNRAIKGFTGREVEMLRMRFIDDMTYEQIGREFNISYARIRQILNRCIRKMKHPYISNYLKEAYFD